MNPANGFERVEGADSISVFSGGFAGPRLAPVRRIPSPPLEGFHDRVVRPYRPVLLDGLIADWPALREWTMDFFIRVYGRYRWNVLAKDDGGYAAASLYGYDNPVPVGEHLRKALEFETEDYMNVPFETLPAELAAMAPPIPYVQASRYLHRAVFIGSEINGAPLHFHLCQNMLAQVFGRKRVLLFHPGEGRRLGWKGPLSASPNFIPMDPFDPERRYWETYQRASGYIVDLEPGDALYIPYGWWHATKILSPSISLFNRWASGWRYVPIMISAAFDRVVAALTRVRKPRVTPERTPELDPPTGSTAGAG